MTAKIAKRPFGRRGPYRVFLVDGYQVRSLCRPDEEFGNWGTHADFPRLVPDGEIWLDSRAEPEERQLLVSTAVRELDGIARGLSAERAYASAIAVERSLRAKLHHVNFRGRQKRRLTVPDDILEGIYCQIPAERLTVYSVNGIRVRDLYKTDYLEGGHSQVYRFIPPGQFWVERDLAPAEIPSVVLHEFTEYCLMKYRHEHYGVAHGLAAHVEFHCRGRLKRSQLPGLTKDIVFAWVDKLNQRGG